MQPNYSYILVDAPAEKKEEAFTLTVSVYERYNIFFLSSGSMAGIYAVHKLESFKQDTLDLRKQENKGSIS